MCIIIGYLAAVGSLTLTVRDFFIFLTWTPPFSLDITGVEPDIAEYCIDIDAEDVYEENPSLPSCGINEPGYNITLPYESVCYTYIIAVYAVNLVGNGEQSNRMYNEDQTSRLRLL